MKKLFVFCISILLIGCGGNSMDNHIGYWQPIDSKALKVVEISKNGDNYFFSENILKKTGLDLWGKEIRPSKPTLLQNNNEKLSIMGIQPIALSPDNKKLFIGKKTYERISQQQLSEIQVKAEMDFNDAENVKLGCKKTSEKYHAESAEIRTKYRKDIKEFTRKHNELTEAYSAELKKCRAIG
ncbi:hypothetical protein HNW13_010365 [Shewanella sp. BF02_Schw]|uniref:hypothetical protein n=1 Tax=Shewanella sp. BF02_Schw TaxID=394908 RepID=UPI00177D50AE|nr:hypothetical protein [Shewanella sp. BF02_Schw]MBO1896172.1 hypothetical protein [Shewanella sp. BF02_Schw]